MLCRRLFISMGRDMIDKRDRYCENCGGCKRQEYWNKCGMEYGCWLWYPVGTIDVDWVMKWEFQVKYYGKGISH